MRPAEQRRCTHASSSCTNTAWPHKSKPRQSKQLVRAVIASVVLNLAIASAVTPSNPAAAAHTACSPLGSTAAPTYRYRVQTPQFRTKTSRGRANSSCMRQKSRLCLIQRLQPRRSRARVTHLCTEPAPHRTALLHPRIAIMYKHRSAARKQAAAEQTARARGKSLGRAYSGNCQRRRSRAPVTQLCKEPAPR